MKALAVCGLSAVFGAAAAQAADRHYHIDITKQDTTIEQKTSTTVAFDGKIPGPLLQATVGDTLSVNFCNKMNEPTLVHWHGVRLPNTMDGTHLSTPKIEPNTCFSYSYPVTHGGTYWYHAHEGRQEGMGMYGGIIFHHKEGEKIETTQDKVMIISDHEGEDPVPHLRQDADWYGVCKHNKGGQSPSWLGAIKAGKEEFLSSLNGAWYGMPFMDLTDSCPTFLANGESTPRLDSAQQPLEKHETMRVRLINAAPSSTYILKSSCSDGYMRIVSKDGVDTKPLDVKQFRMAPAETYDVVVRKEDAKACAVQAFSVDASGSVIGLIGADEQKNVQLPEPPAKPNLYIMDHGIAGHDMSHMDHASPTPAKEPESMASMMAHMTPEEHMAHMKMMAEMAKASAEPKVMGDEGIEKKDALDKFYSGLTGDYAASEVDTLPVDGKKWHELTISLTGQMVGKPNFVWSLDGVVHSESEPLILVQDDNYRITFENTTMMDHPMHLHGYHFMVTNALGDKTMPMHTVIVPAMQSATIEFNANKAGRWPLHCHIFDHMRTGMMRDVFVAPEGKTPDDVVPNLPHYHSGGHGTEWTAQASVMISPWLPEIEASYGNIHHSFNFSAAGSASRQEARLFFEENLSPKFSIFAGGEFEREKDNGIFESSPRAIAGLHYTLPLSLEFEVAGKTDLRNGKMGWETSIGANEIPLTERLGLSWQFGLKQDPGHGLQNYHRVDLGYKLNENVSIDIFRDTHYNVDVAAGINVKF